MTILPPSVLAVCANHGLTNGKPSHCFVERERFCYIVARAPLFCHSVYGATRSGQAYLSPLHQDFLWDCNPGRFQGYNRTWKSRLEKIHFQARIIDVNKISVPQELLNRGLHSWLSASHSLLLPWALFLCESLQHSFKVKTNRMKT